MRLTPSILSLPTSILLLIISHTSAHASLDSDTNAQAKSEPQSAAQWPYNLPPHVKFWPEDPPSRRRDLEAIEEHIRLGRKPVGVMKMSDDEGEKFYMEYWQFEGELELDGQRRVFDSPRESAAVRRRNDFSQSEEEDRSKGNESAVVNFRPSFVLHTENIAGAEELKARQVLRSRDVAGVLAALKARDFTCPTGTKDCSMLMSPTSCCATDETCFSIPDTGLGVIGCCPSGAQCVGAVTQCDAPNTPCPSILGGGCCIPGFSCVEGGCAMDPPAVVTTVITRTFTVTASSVTRTSTSLSTVTSTSSTACPLNVQACPASLGGGCCPTDRVCAFSSCAPSSSSASSTSPSTSLTTTTSATGVIPVRPTSGTTTPTLTTTTDSGPTTCPTGFYACEAYYEGGCCRTGRNCEKTSCPPTSSTTIISSGVTVVVPVGSAATVATPTGACASGWETCAASVGGNCCPSGWGCGTASCLSVGPSRTAVLQKASPGGAGRIGGGRRWGAAAVVLVMSMFVLD
ncbi:hypothetical protein BKA64DRAFT_469500 [Cadophora sp. MPI-SDFR-AT-0126]|nr:hypothetical protein BKA64DRAFT_469500 [Leotiomycetes sp. MPI-SDFR-AT-0126]